ncbi:MAG TPA: hypothetical protein VD997_11550 [Phycisphaerales bacterium]|nr:hypothetical protein [Phycisphaerales bacterium]
MPGSNMPQSKRDLLPWALAHADQWVLNAAQIGVPPATALAFKTLAGTFSSTSGAADAARQASKDATLADDNSYTTVRAMGGQLVNMIKAYAEANNDPNVYVLSGLKPNSGPGVVPSPVAPDKMTMTVNGDGSVTLKWKVTQPAGCTGVQYRVLRRLGGEDNFSLIGTSGSKKSFQDKTIPFGTDSVAYQVQPWRGEVEGPVSIQFGFQFGTGGGGNLNVKLAA